jgi:hypothetical protein
VLCSILSACTHTPFALVDGSFHGHYYYGFERNDFIPCGADFAGRWSVTGDLKAVNEFILANPGHQFVYVRWHGDLSGKGSYGFDGLEREFRVTKVLAVATYPLLRC